jgi:hypothetical protein
MKEEGRRKGDNRSWARPGGVLRNKEGGGSKREEGTKEYTRRKRTSRREIGEAAGGPAHVSARSSLGVRLWSCLVSSRLVRHSLLAVPLVAFAAPVPPSPPPFPTPPPTSVPSFVSLLLRISSSEAGVSHAAASWGRELGGRPRCTEVCGTRWRDRPEAQAQEPARDARLL